MRSARPVKILTMIVLTAVMAFFPVPTTAEAAQQPTSITVYYQGTAQNGEEILLSGAEFSLYKVGTVRNGEGVLTEPFDKAGVSLNDLSAAGQKQAAQTLYQYALAKGISGEKTVIQSSGYGVFADLERGIYLIAQDEDLAYGGGVFRSLPFLVSVPELDENGFEVYDVSAEPKNEWSADKTPVPSVTVLPTVTPAEKDPGEGTGDNGYGGASGSDASVKSGSSSSPVRTGDDTPVLSFAGLLICGGTAAYLVIRRKRAQQ